MIPSQVDKSSCNKQAWISFILFLYFLYFWGGSGTVSGDRAAEDDIGRCSTLWMEPVWAAHYRGTSAAVRPSLSDSAPFALHWRFDAPSVCVCACAHVCLSPRWIKERGDRGWEGQRPESHFELRRLRWFENHHFPAGKFKKPALSPTVIHPSTTFCTTWY